MKLELKDMKHVYPTGDEALKGIDLVIEGNEPVAIIGQNGAGKTTLVKHFNGILRPTSGQVLINGEDINLSLIHICFSVSKECSRRSNIWSKLPARRRASSEPLESPIRRVRSRPSVILPAVFAICSMCSRALLTIRYPPREAERMIKGSMRKNINSMLPASWLLLWRWMAPRIQTPSSHPQGIHRSDT